MTELSSSIGYTICIYFMGYIGLSYKLRNKQSDSGAGIVIMSYSMLPLYAPGYFVKLSAFVFLSKYIGLQLLGPFLIFVVLYISLFRTQMFVTTILSGF